jgi:hypothetical protein
MLKHCAHLAADLLSAAMALPDSVLEGYNLQEMKKGLQYRRP